MPNIYHKCGNNLNQNLKPIKNMLSDQDLKQIKARGISEEQVEYQLNQFKSGFPFLKLESAAGIGNGIISPDEDARLP